MYYPTLEEVRQLKRYGNLVPVCREIQADLETPVTTPSSSRVLRVESDWLAIASLVPSPRLS